MVLVNGLQPHVALALRKLHVELNDMLLAGGVLPRIRHQVQRPAQGSAGSRAAPAGVPGAAGAPGRAGEAPRLPGLPAGMTLSQAMALKDLMPGAMGSPLDVGAIVGALLDGPATSRHYGARLLANPEGSLHARAMMTPAPEGLIAQLSQLQSATVADAAGGTGDLAAVVDNLARAREHPLEQLTGELVAVVFDFVLHDRDLSAAVKAELARLQIVGFKAALLDRTFFAKRTHPMPELLTAITESATDPQIDAGPRAGSSRDCARSSTRSSRGSSTTSPSSSPRASGSRRWSPRSARRASGRSRRSPRSSPTRSAAKRCGRARGRRSRSGSPPARPRSSSAS